MKLHARHGWGYDVSFWAPLAAIMPHLTADDRGYFGPPRADPIAADEPHVLIGHSYGAVRMLAEAGPACRGLVAINGFDRLVGTDGLPGVPSRVLARMKQRCAVDPDTTVAAFRARCGDDRPLPDRATLRLADDLADMTIARAPPRPDLPLLRLDGAADPLLLPAHRALCFGGAPMRERAGGGHLLPLTDVEWCAKTVLSFVAGLA